MAQAWVDRHRHVWAHPKNLVPLEASYCQNWRSCRKRRHDLGKGKALHRAEEHFSKAKRPWGYWKPRKVPTITQRTCQTTERNGSGNQAFLELGLGVQVWDWAYRLKDQGNERALLRAEKAAGADGRHPRDARRRRGLGWSGRLRRAYQEKWKSKRHDRWSEIGTPACLRLGPRRCAYLIRHFNTNTTNLLN